MSEEYMGRGYFSLIQYCPDLSRLEAANIGVVLFCPERRFLAAKAAAGKDRIARFFGRESFDADRLNVAKRAFENSLRNQTDGLRTLEDFQRFIDTRGNDLVLTPPRSVKVTDPERDLAQLFSELVGGRARHQGQQPMFPVNFGRMLDRSVHAARSAHGADVFFVPGLPIAKGSARGFLHRHTGRIIVIQDNRKKQKTWSAQIGLCARAAGVTLSTAPIRLRLAFQFSRPKSHLNAAGLKLAAPRAHTQKPDLDKLVRCVLDALTGLAYPDDSRVVSVDARKDWAEKSGCHITVEAAEDR